KGQAEGGYLVDQDAVLPVRRKQVEDLPLPGEQAGEPGVAAGKKASRDDGGAPGVAGGDGASGGVLVDLIQLFPAHGKPGLNGGVWLHWLSTGKAFAVDCLLIPR